MWQWLQDNWWLAALIVAYVVERLPEIPAAWKRRSRLMVETLERFHRYVGRDTPEGRTIHTLKEWIGEATPPQDKAPMGDLIAEAGDEKHTRSPARRVAGRVVHLLPLVSRFLNRKGK